MGFDVGAGQVLGSHYFNLRGNHSKDKPRRSASAALSIHPWVWVVNCCWGSKMASKQPVEYRTA